MYFIYILQCVDGTYYTGSTNDIAKRVEAHNIGSTGAKYTRSRGPVILKYSENFPTKSDALRREYEIKRWKRAKKEQLFSP